MDFDTRIVVDNVKHVTPTPNVTATRIAWHWKWNGTTRIHSTTGT
jgi:hypothetical protein